MSINRVCIKLCLYFIYTIHDLLIVISTLFLCTLRISLEWWIYLPWMDILFYLLYNHHWHNLKSFLSWQIVDIHNNVVLLIWKINYESHLKINFISQQGYCNPAFLLTDTLLVISTKILRRNKQNIYKEQLRRIDFLYDRYSTCSFVSSNNICNNIIFA